MKLLPPSSLTGFLRPITLATIIAGVLVLTSSSATAQILTIINDGFEDPNVGSGFFADSGTVSGWTQTGFNSVIAANGSRFGVTGAFNGNSDGLMSDVGQAGGIDLSGGISQSISGFIAGNTYTLSFYLEGDGNESLDVTLGETDYGYITPSAGDSFNLVTKTYVATTSGPQILSFTANLAAASSDFAFVDNVSIVTQIVPEPSTYVLFGVALLLMIVVARRRASLI